MSDRFIRIRVGEASPPGARQPRLRLEYDPGWGDAMLSDENVLSEHGLDPDAHHIENIASIPLSHADVDWLLFALSDLAARMAADEAESGR